MELRQAFDTVMETTPNMALATSTGGKPNVRVVTYGYDKADPKRVYFTTFKGNQKAQEMEKNPFVTALPLPTDPEAQVEVRLHGRAQKSAKTLEEVAPLILAKAPSFVGMVQQGGPMLQVYEVCFEEAAITIGVTDAQNLKL